MRRGFVLFVIGIFCLSFVLSVQCDDGIDNDNDLLTGGGIDALVEQMNYGGSFTTLTLSGSDKYIYTWLSTITCEDISGTNVVINPGANPYTLRDLVNNKIAELGIPIGSPAALPLLRSRGSSGSGNVWNTDGVIDVNALYSVCRILGYKDYVSSTCLDNERSGRYPSGKCNYHSPEGNELSYFSGTIVLNNCSDGIDNDLDGLIDFPDDLGCDSGKDASEIPHDPDCDDLLDDDEAGAGSCIKDCSATACGPDPNCGKPCGPCASNETCISGNCELTPVDVNLTCGDIFMKNDFLNFKINVGRPSGMYTVLNVTIDGVLYEEDDYEEEVKSSGNNYVKVLHQLVNSGNIKTETFVREDSTGVVYRDVRNLIVYDPDTLIDDYFVASCIKKPGSYLKSSSSRIEFDASNSVAVKYNAFEDRLIYYNLDDLFFDWVFVSEGNRILWTCSGEGRSPCFKDTGYNKYHFFRNFPTVNDNTAYLSITIPSHLM